MDNRAEIREFLTTRRARLTPGQLGLPTVGERRVPGLRRGEVATLRGLSLEYYGRHDVRTHGSGMKRFRHEAVGHLALAYESVELISEPGLILTLYAAEPGSPTAENLRLLASWAADHRVGLGTAL